MNLENIGMFNPGRKYTSEEKKQNAMNFLEKYIIVYQNTYVKFQKVMSTALAYVN